MALSTSPSVQAPTVDQVPRNTRSTFTGILTDIRHCTNYQELQVVFRALYDAMNARAGFSFDQRRAKKAYSPVQHATASRMQVLNGGRPRATKSLEKNYRTLYGRLMRWIGPEVDQLDERVESALQVVADALQARMDELRQVDSSHSWNKWVEEKRRMAFFRWLIKENLEIRKLVA